MIRLLTLVFLCLTFLLSFSSVEAVLIPSSEYYDWGGWYKKPSANVSLSADVSTPRGLLPDSPFYFFKTLAERFDLLLTFNNKNKSEKLIRLAEERLSEAKYLLESKKYGKLPATLENYSRELITAKDSVSSSQEQDFMELSSQLEQTSAKHSLVLEKLDLVVPEENRASIKDSLSVSREIMDVSSDLLGKSPLSEELKQRLESLESLGILPTKEFESIRSLPTRRDVRDRLTILVGQNILPISDIKKVDQAQIDLFPNDFLRVLEVRKIYEYVKLQNEQPDTETFRKIEDYAKSFKAGYFVPVELKKWWIPVTRLRELKSTLRPNLVAGSLFVKDTDEYNRLQLILDSFKPDEQQLKEVDQWVAQNPGGVPPEHIQRIIALALNLGTTIEWKPPGEVLSQVNLGYPLVDKEE